MDEEIEYRITEKGMGYFLGCTEERNRWLKAVERVQAHPDRLLAGSYEDGFDAALDAVMAEMEREDA